MYRTYLPFFYHQSFPHRPKKKEDTICIYVCISNVAPCLFFFFMFILSYHKSETRIDRRQTSPFIYFRDIRVFIPFKFC